MSEDLAQRARVIADSLDYATISSVTPDGKPWGTPVSHARDRAFNLYWLSWKGAEHSKNIRAVGSVFITIFNSTNLHGHNHQKGLYIEATAHELDNPEDLACIHEQIRWLGENPQPQNFLGESGKRFYKAIPSRVWLNNLSASDVTPSTNTMRIEVPLSDLQNND